MIHLSTKTGVDSFETIHWVVFIKHNIYSLYVPKKTSVAALVFSVLTRIKQKSSKIYKKFLLFEHSSSIIRFVAVDSCWVEASWL